MRLMRQSAFFMLLFWLLFGLLATAFVSAAAPRSGAGVDTVAESAVVMDGNGKVLFEKDPNKKLPPASVTKVMTLLLATEAVEQGRIKLADPVYASENAWRQGGSQIWLEPGEMMTVKELLTAVAVVSANDAAVALMEHIYGSEQAAVAAMNQRAGELGLKNTHFANVNGLPTADHYMSAMDTALIAREALRHPVYLEMCSIKEYWLRDGKNWLVNTNKLLWWYKGADGLKTGWTEEAKYCFVGTAERDSLRLIAVVFATPQPRSHLRESMKLLDWGFANYAAVPIAEKGAVVERVRVTKGTAKEVQLVTVDKLNLVVPKGQNKNIQKKVVAESQVKAPVTAGQKYGELVAVKDGVELGKVDLVAENAVERAGFFKVFQTMLGGLFTITG